MTRVAILGTVGVPASYGGFETLAENLVLYNARNGSKCSIEVYCSSKAYSKRQESFSGAKLHYLPLEANGKQAMFYDILSLINAAFRGVEVVLLLGHGGSFILPILKLFTKTKFITNIDGIEWRREKWSGIARWIIRKSEAMAIEHSHITVADNQGIQEYVFKEFQKMCEVIPYGGDHAKESELNLNKVMALPNKYALALCRIEPENNVEMILEAFCELEMPLVFIGNWEKSAYGRDLKARYSGQSTIIIHDPVYELGALRAIRERASMYIHGHSAGGTNPSLVEMMHFGLPILAHGCSFNRYTTEQKALYFQSSSELADAVRDMNSQIAAHIGSDMEEIARRRYTWEIVGAAYFDLVHQLNSK